MDSISEQKRKLIIRHELEQDQELRVFRVAILSWMIITMLMYEQLGVSGTATAWIIGILMLLLGVSIMRLFFFKPDEITELEKYLIIGAELITIFFVMIYTGGIGSPFFWVFPITLILYAVRFSMQLTLTSAMLVTLLYVIVLVFSILGLTGSTGSLQISVLNILLMWIVTVAATYSVRQLQHRHREIWENELQSSQQEVAAANTQLQQKQEELEKSNAELLNQQDELKFAQERAELRIHELAYIRSISDALLNVFELEKILSIGAEMVAKALSIDNCDIYLLDDDDQYAYLKKQYILDDNLFFQNAVKVSPQNNRFADILKSQKEPLLIQGNTFEDEYKVPSQLLEIHGFKSTLLLPVWDQQRVLAVFGLNNTREERDFQQNEIQLADTLVSQIENFIGRARLFQESERQREDSEKRARVLHLVNNLTQILTSALPPEEIYKRLVHQFADVVDVDRSVLFLYEKDMQRVRMVGEFDRTQKKLSELGDAFPLERHPMMKQIIVKKSMVQIEHADDPDLEDIVRQTLRRYGIKSLLMVPMIYQDEVIGIIGLDELKETRTFNEEEIQLLSTLANEAAIAVVNSRLRDDSQRNLAEREFILDVMHEISFIDTLPELFETLVYRISNGMRVDRSLILMMNKMSRSYETKAIHDFRGEHFQELGEPYTLSNILSLFKDGDDVIVQVDNMDYLPVQNNPLIGNLIAQNVKSFVIVPLMVRQEQIGLLVLGQITEPRHFRKHELEFARGYAEQAAIAIHHNRVIESEKKRNRYWEIMTHISRQVRSIEEMDQMLDKLVNDIQRQFRYENALFLFVNRENQTLEMHAIAGKLKDRYKAYHQLPINRGMVGRAATRGRTVVSNDVRKETSYIAVDGIFTRSELSVPIKIEDEVVGVLDVESNQLNGFDETDVAAFETLADQLALTLSTVRFIESLKSAE